MKTEAAISPQTATCPQEAPPSATQESIQRFLSKYPVFEYLIDSTPALLLCLTESDDLLPEGKVMPTCGVEALATWKQKELAALFGFPEAFWSVKLLRKLKGQTLCTWNIAKLRQLAWMPGFVRYLQHQTGIHDRLFSLMNHRWGFSVMHPRIVETSKLPRVQGGIFHYLDEFEPFMRTIHEHWPELNEGRTVDSPASLKRCIEKAYKRFWVLCERDGIVFPEAPFMGTKRIQPITTPAELLREAREMEHCAVRRLVHILFYQTYIYRCLEPRLTIEIRYSFGGYWTLTECRGYKNEQPSPEVLASVKAELLGSNLNEVTGDTLPEYGAIISCSNFYWEQLYPVAPIDGFEFENLKAMPDSASQ